MNQWLAILLWCVTLPLAGLSVSAADNTDAWHIGIGDTVVFTIENTQGVCSELVDATRSGGGRSLESRNGAAEEICRPFSGHGNAGRMLFYALKAIPYYPIVAGIKNIDLDNLGATSVRYITRERGSYYFGVDDEYRPGFPCPPHYLDLAFHRPSKHTIVAFANGRIVQEFSLSFSSEESFKHLCNQVKEMLTPGEQSWLLIGSPKLIQEQKLRCAILNPVVKNGFVVDVAILDGGMGYTHPPEILFTGGTRSRTAKAVTVVQGGQIISVTITDPGNEYFESPSTRVESPIAPFVLLAGGYNSDDGKLGPYSIRQALVEPEIINGFIIGAKVIDGGLGYSEPPEVTISDSFGYGARAVAVVEGGGLINLVFAEVGVDYSEETSILISPPKLNLCLVAKLPNNYYVIEASSDLVSWEQVVEPFFAEETTHTVKVAVGDDDMRYFRAIQLP